PASSPSDQAQTPGSPTTSYFRPVPGTTWPSAPTSTSTSMASIASGTGAPPGSMAEMPVMTEPSSLSSLRRGHTVTSRTRIGSPPGSGSPQRSVPPEGMMATSATGAPRQVAHRVDERRANAGVGVLVGDDVVPDLVGRHRGGDPHGVALVLGLGGPKLGQALDLVLAQRHAGQDDVGQALAHRADGALLHDTRVGEDTSRKRLGDLHRDLRRLAGLVA